jgi:hypothetical protein
MFPDKIKGMVESFAGQLQVLGGSPTNAAMAICTILPVAGPSTTEPLVRDICLGIMYNCV